MNYMMNINYKDILPLFQDNVDMNKRVLDISNLHELRKEIYKCLIVT